MSEQDIDAQLDSQRRRNEDGGAYMYTPDVHDPRLSKLIAWGGGIAAVVISSGVVWAGSQLVGIRESLRDLAVTQREQSAATTIQINDLKAEVRTLRQSNDYLIQKVASLEGKAERGFRQGKEPFRE